MQCRRGPSSPWRFQTDLQPARTGVHVLSGVLPAVGGSLAPTLGEAHVDGVDVTWSRRLQGSEVQRFGAGEVEDGSAETGRDPMNRVVGCRRIVGRKTQSGRVYEDGDVGAVVDPDLAAAPTQKKTLNKERIRVLHGL